MTRTTALLSGCALLASLLLSPGPLRAGEKSAKAPTPSPAPASKPIALRDPVATVDGEKISRTELEEALGHAVGRMGGTPDALNAEQRLQGYHAVLQDLILERIIRPRSAKTDVTDAEIEAQIDSIRKRIGSEETLSDELKKAGRTLDQLKGDIRTALKQQRWVEAQVAGQDTVTEEDLKAFYDQNRQAFQQPEQVRASHILVRTPPDATEAQLAEKKQAIEAIAARIKKGEDFAAVAKETSEDPGSKDAGGDLDFFPRERMVPEFAAVAFELKTGQVSEPVKTQFGYHLIKVTDHRDARTVPFDEVKPRLEEHLKQLKKRDSISKLFESLRAEAKVETFLPPLPSPEAAPAPAETPAKP